MVRARLQPARDQPAPLRQAVVERGGFPREQAELRTLPGIGPYTAAAIACFAFGEQVAAPDVNARRVLERAFGDPDLPPPPGRAYEWNQALFDLGSERLHRPPAALRAYARSRPDARRAGMTFAPLRKQSRFEGSFRQRRSDAAQAAGGVAAPGRCRAWTTARRWTRSSRTAWPRWRAASRRCLASHPRAACRRDPAARAATRSRRPAARPPARLAGRGSATRASIP